MAFISITLVFLLFITILVVFFVKKYNNYINSNKKYLGKLMIRNIFIYISLIIITGVVSTFYEIFFTGRYSNSISYDSLMVGILIIIILLFFNLLGYIHAILNINKIYLIIMIHGIFIVSTILMYKLVSYCINTLIEKDIIKECPNILFLGIIIIMENISSYVSIKLCPIPRKK
jgi:hypothetical protein